MKKLFFIVILFYGCNKDYVSKTHTLYKGYVEYVNGPDLILIQGDFKYEPYTYKRRGIKYVVNHFELLNDTISISITFKYNKLKNEMINPTLYAEIEPYVGYGYPESFYLKGRIEKEDLFFGIFLFANEQPKTTVPMTQFGSIYLTPKN